MKFLTPGEKLKEIRKSLKIKQGELEAAGVSRNFISMVEGNKRKLSSEVALKISDIFKEKIKSLGIDMDIDYEYLKLSPKKAAEKYCDENLNSNLSIEDIDEIIEIAKNYKLTTPLFKVYLLKADILYNKGDFEHSSIYYYEALELCSKISRSNERAYIYNNIGKCRYGEINYIEALSFFTKAYEVSIKFNDNKIKMKSRFNIALTNKKLGNMEEAVKNIDIFIDECDPINEFENYALASILKANCYIENNKKQESIETYINLINSLNINDSNILGLIYNNMGLTYTNINNFDLAIKYFDKAIDIRSKLNDSDLSHSLIDKASALLNKSMYAQAIQCAKDGLNLAIEHNDLEYLLSGYHALEKIYKKLNDTNMLEETYHNIIKLLKCNLEDKEVIRTYIKLAILNIDKDNFGKSKEYLTKLININ